MNAEALDLARRFVACRKWVWLPGIRAAWGSGSSADMRVVGVDASCVVVVFPQSVFAPLRRIAHAEILPDLTDAMTRAGLLEVVRRAWGDETACVRFVYRYPMPSLWAWEAGVTGQRQTGHAESEPRALLAALEAAK